MGVLTDLLAPLRCVACSTPADGDLCASCAGRVEPIAPPLCWRCGTPSVRSTGQSCPACRELEGFRRARSLLVYAEPASRLVISLKRRGRPGLAAAAGGLLAEVARRAGMEPAVVTFVPAGRRARDLGYDHAALLARAVASELRVGCASLVRRVREGPRQADVSLAERRANVRDRFAARPCGGPILVVDDVFTTGATAEACALALLGGGAASVDVLTFARTPRRWRA